MAVQALHGACKTKGALPCDICLSAQLKLDVRFRSLIAEIRRISYDAVNCFNNSVMRYYKSAIAALFLASITDNSGNVLAIVDVLEYAPRKYQGRIISSNFPEDLTRLLNEFMELAEDQVFSLLDEVAEEIEGFSLTFAPTGSVIHDLQVYRGELISFQV